MQQSNLNLGTIGQKLEYARHQKGLSVSEVGRKTKILAKIIEAMEADNFEELSAPVYAKSFIRMYAKLLDIDPQPLVDEYMKTHAPKQKRTHHEELRHNLTNIITPEETVDEQSTTQTKKAAPHLKKPSAPIHVRIKPASNFTKTGLIAGGGIFALLLVILSVKECGSDPDPIPAPTPNAVHQVKRTPLISKVPDVYLTEENTIEVDLNKK